MTTPHDERDFWRDADAFIHDLSSVNPGPSGAGLHEMLDRLSDSVREANQGTRQPESTEATPDTVKTQPASAAGSRAPIALIDRQALQARMDEIKADGQRDADYSRRWLTLAGRATVLSACQSIAYPEDADLALDALGARFPHFGPVVEEVRNWCSVGRLKPGAELRLPPLLLVGPPASGKSAFLRALAQVLQTPYEFIDGAQITAPFVLTGGHLTWAGGTCGRVLNTLIERRVSNPMIILDEIDKLARGIGGIGGTGPAIENVLLSLLEPSTARRFRDESLDLPVDASGMIWMATANDLNAVSDVLRSRMQVLTVRAPSLAEKRDVIVPAIFHDLLVELGIAAQVTPLPDAVRAHLAQADLRAVRRLLMRAIGAAVRRQPEGLVRITLADLPAAEAPRFFGFQPVDPEEIS